MLRNRTQTNIKTDKYEGNIMSGSKKRIVLTAILTIALLVLSMCVLAACHNENEQNLKNYNVVFDMNDGSGDSVEKTLNANGISLFAPEQDREGYIFAGWAFDKSGKEPFDAAALKDETNITLYAIWSAEIYSVSFLDSNGSLILQRKVEYGKSATPPSDGDISSFVPNGYVFAGWDTAFDSVKSNLSVKMLIASSTQTFTVKFMDGDTLITTFEGEAGNGIPQDVVAPDKEGFKFDKWETEDGKKFSSESIFGADETYYAKYIIKTPVAPVINGANVVYGSDIILSYSGEQEISSLSYVYEWLDANSNVLGQGRQYALSAPNAGLYSFKLRVTASCQGYQSAFVVTALKTITVSKATLTATLQDINIIYGDDAPTSFDVSYTGFVNGDDESAVNTDNASIETSYSKGNNAGDYAVSLVGLAADNYEIVGTNGAVSATLKVAKKEISLQISQTATFTNSPIVKEFENLSAQGLIDGDVINLTFTTNGYTVGEYSTRQNSVAASAVILNGKGENVNANYAISIDATIAISPADISFSLPEQTVFEYDANSHSANITDVTANIAVLYSIDGVNYSSEVPAFTNVGVYTVWAKMSADNYNDASTQYDVAITPAVIKIGATAQQTVYGQAFSLDKTKWEVLSGDTYNNVLSVSLSTNYTVGDPVGVYDIVISVNDNENFTIQTQNSALTVERAQLTATVSNASVIYGDEFVPTSSLVSLQGLYGSDDAMLAVSTTYTVLTGEVGKAETITCTSANQNYDLTVVEGSLTVQKRSLTVSIDNSTVVYGDEYSSFAHSILLGTLAEGDEYTAESICSYTTNSDCGTYAIGANVAIYNGETDKSGNYDVTINEGILTVSRRAVSVRINDASAIYGEQPAAFTDVILSGTFVNGDAYSLDYNCAYAAGADVNAYTISGNIRVFNGDADKSANYDISLANGTLSVTARNISVNANGASVIYGEPFDVNSSSYTIDGSAFGADQLSVSYGCTYTQGDNAGNYDISLSAAINRNGEDKSANYNITLNAGTLTVQKRNVTIRHNMSKAENGDCAIIVLTSQMADGAYRDDSFAGTLRTVSAQSGTYSQIGIDLIWETALSAINAKGETVLDNYDITYEISVTIAVDTIEHTATGYTGTYDSTAHGGSVTVTQEVENCQIVYSTDKINYTSQNPTFTDAGEYTVYFTITALDMSPTSGEFKVVINKKAISLSIDANIAYGDPFSATPSMAIDGTVNEFDLQAISLSTQCGYSQGDDAGTYPITFNYTENANYDITVLDSALVVTAKQVNVVYEGSHTVEYGDVFTPPSFTASDANAAQFITLSTNYSAGSVVGEYTLTAVCSSDNYALTQTNGTITVVAKTVNVSVENVNVVYGDALVMPSFVCDVEEAKPYIALTSDYKTGNEAGGTYTLDFTCTNTNYALVKTTATVAVLPRAVTITADDITVTYGSEINPTYSVNNVYNDYTVSGVTLSYDNADAGSHIITVSVADNDPNYTFISQNGTLTVNKATLNASLSGELTITYGDALPSYSLNYNGFVNGDDQSVLSGELAVECEYTTSPSAGTFAISASGISAQNYDIVISTATLTVNKAQLTVTVKDHVAITYSDPVPTDFDCDITGFVFNDSADLDTFKSAIHYVTTYKQGSNASAQGYDFNADVNQTQFANYEIVAGEAKKLIVNKADYAEGEITHEPLQIMYAPDNKLDRLTLATGFAWTDPTTTIGEVGTRSFPAIYSGDLNHNPCTVSVTVTVTKSTNVTIVNNDVLEADWTANGTQLHALVNANSTNPEDTSVTYNIKTAAIAQTNATAVVDGGAYTIELVSKETANYVSVSKTIVVKIKAASLNGTLYTVEDALAQGGTITLMGNAFISSNVEVKSGTTLILPSSADTSSTIGSPTYGAGVKNAYIDTNANYIEHILTVHQGVSVTVNGTVLVNGLLGVEGGIREGHTSGAHSQIVNNGTLDFNNGSKFDVRGYVKGSGVAHFRSGATVYSPFVVLDFRGGTNTVTVYRKGGITPFNQYEMPNIACESYTYSGATHKVYLDLYASSKHNTSVSDMYGSSGVLQIASGGYIHKLYNRTSQKTTLTIVGNVSMGSLSLTVSGVTAKMSDVYFPIPWTFDIIIGDGSVSSSLTASYQYKLMTGASLTVNKNATLNLTGKAIVYSAFTDTAFGGAVYPNKSAALLTVNGTLNATGSFAGKILSSTNGAKVILGSSAITSLSSTEGNSGDTSSAAAIIGIGMKFVTVATVTETATLVNANGSTATASTGKTYTYNAGTGMWA